MSHSSTLDTPCLEVIPSSENGAGETGDRPGSDRRRKVGGGLNGQRGFTILEIMIALAIIAMLVAVAMSNLHGIFGDSQVKVAKLFVTTEVEIPLTSYRIDMGDFPTAEDGGLKALWVAPANKTDRWHGPYAKGSKPPPDPWGNDYKYVYPGVHNKGSYDLWSLGPGGVDGGPNNIGNW